MGQHFMTKEELDTCFPVLTYDGAGHLKGLAESAGLIVDFHTVGNTEYIRCLVDAANAIIIGATRSGKDAASAIDRDLALICCWGSICLSRMLKVKYTRTHRILHEKGL